MNRLSTVSGMLMLLAACAGTPQQQVTNADDPSQKNLVCRNVRLTGTGILRRVCVTPEEAAAQKKAAEDAMQQSQNRSNVTPTNQPPD